MTSEAGGQEPAPSPVARGRRFKPHELRLAEGGRLILGVDGAIDQLDAHGATIQHWSVDHPEWPDQAIRFGLFPQARTVTPHGQVPGTKPPRR